MNFKSPQSWSWRLASFDYQGKEKTKKLCGTCPHLLWLYSPQRESKLQRGDLTVFHFIQIGCWALTGTFKHYSLPWGLPAVVGASTPNAHPPSEAGSSAHFYPLPDPAFPSEDLESSLTGWPVSPHRSHKACRRHSSLPDQATHQMYSPWLDELGRADPGPAAPWQPRPWPEQVTTVTSPGAPSPPTTSRSLPL